MSLPLLKLGTPALKTLSKPIASRLKAVAARHPKFRTFIISIAPVAVAALVFEVQRSARPEARKEEIRREKLQAMKQRDEELKREVVLLKQKLDELEQLARGRGLAGVINFRTAPAENVKSIKAA